MEIKINGKTIIAGVFLSVSLAFADYTSSISPKSVSLSSQSEVAVGTIAMWGQGSLPSGWVELDGGSTSGYPDLAAIYGSNVPDFRGRFVRALDSGAGVDSEPSRAVLSTQEDAIRNITATVRSAMRSGAGGTLSAGGAFTEGPSGTTVPDHYNRSSSNYNGFNFDASLQVPTASENRVKNIAVRYIIKAE